MFQGQSDIKQNQVIEQVVGAVNCLSELGFPMNNIRVALPKLTGITYRQVAGIIGSSRAAVSNTMNSARGNPELQKKIASVYGVPCDLIFNPRVPFHNLAANDG